ncbi:hypothetical protein B296_00002877 [Ensete ventricosum]|uniref:Uncharacterized protein n=1 Tax=Ensete ventricosum TaxID=4639 RepID=A0A427BA44_ENSVE|nr:hypothetical protein B296_00002877 [Ensete ventricosum]
MRVPARGVAGCSSRVIPFMDKNGHNVKDGILGDSPLSLLSSQARRFPAVWARKVRRWYPHPRESGTDTVIGPYEPKA